MKNRILTQGLCAGCNQPLDPEWCGSNPSLGTTCRDCYSDVQVFGLDNVELMATRTLRFDPLFGVREYHFSFAGTKVLVNGREGVVAQTQADCAWVKFGRDKLSTPIKGLGYWDLKDLYRDNGGIMEPGPSNFAPHTPTPVELLPEPLYPVFTESRPGWIYVHVGDWTMRDRRADFPFYGTLHAFCNLYVRWKYGLSPNFCSEGGFMGDGFEARNAGGHPASGLSVSGRSLDQKLANVSRPEDAQTMQTLHRAEDLRNSLEQARPGVVQNATAETVIANWVLLMRTLLSYDWESMPYQTEQDVYACFCRMQDVLRNLLEPQELADALAFARDNQMVHAGSSY